MRFAFIAIPAMLVCGSAAAEGWQEYIYADYQFAISFPESPKIDAGRFEFPGAASVPRKTASEEIPRRADTYPPTAPCTPVDLTSANATVRPGLRRDRPPAPRCG